jgi:Putative transposase
LRASGSSAWLGFQRHRARRYGIRAGRSGSVTVIQRFGGGLNLNVHFHTLLLDGVFVEGQEGRSSSGPCRRRPMTRSAAC